MKISVILDGFVGAAAIAATVVLSPFLRGRYRRWGAIDEEVRQVIPGESSSDSRVTRYWYSSRAYIIDPPLLVTFRRDKQP